MTIHKNLHVADEIIIILGYKLHPDGMATRVLRDRVERAAILYKELMEASHHPLIIVSGKGKREIGVFKKRTVYFVLIQRIVYLSDLRMKFKI
jgi:hypothetical protein